MNPKDPKHLHGSHDSKGLPAFDAAVATARLARWLRNKGLSPDEAASLTDAFEILFGGDHAPHD